MDTMLSPITTIFILAFVAFGFGVIIHTGYKARRFTDRLAFYAALPALIIIVRVVGDGWRLGWAAVGADWAVYVGTAIGAALFLFALYALGFAFGQRRRRRARSNILPML